MIDNIDDALAHWVELGHGEGWQTKRAHRQDQQMGEVEAVAEGDQSGLSLRQVRKKRQREGRSPGPQGRKPVKLERKQQEDAVQELPHEQGQEIGGDLDPSLGSIWIPGQPTPAPRVRVGRWGAYYGKQYTAWLAAATEYVEQSWDGGKLYAPDPLWAHVAFYVQRPKSHYGTGRNSMKVKPGPEKQYPLPNGDIDNFLKGPLDAIKGVAYDDDKQIAQVMTSKSWTVGSEDVPGVRVSLMRPT